MISLRSCRGGRVTDAIYVVTLSPRWIMLLGMRKLNSASKISPLGATADAVQRFASNQCIVEKWKTRVNNGQDAI